MNAQIATQQAHAAHAQAMGNPSPRARAELQRALTSLDACSRQGKTTLTHQLPDDLPADDREFVVQDLIGRRFGVEYLGRNTWTTYRYRHYRITWPASGA